MIYDNKDTKLKFIEMTIDRLFGKEMTTKMQYIEIAFFLCYNSFIRIERMDTVIENLKTVKLNIEGEDNRKVDFVFFCYYIKPIWNS